MKRAVFIHGWYGHPDDGWWPWLSDQLAHKGFEVIAPQFPSEAKPQMDEWLESLRSAVGSLDSNTYLIGHSLGCITALRFLEQQPTDIKAGGLVLVAGFTEDLAFEGYDKSLADFFTTPIDWGKIKQHVKNAEVISSDNDPTVPAINHQRLVDSLGANSTWEHNKKHMTGDDGVLEIDSVLSAVLSLSGDDRSSNLV